MTNKSLYHLSLLFLLDLFTSCSLSTDNGIPSQQYIAVQAESGDDWSIIDSEGNVIVEEEYDADDQVSPIYDKTYWVKSDDTYQLYSIDNPKKPLNDEEYTAATIMFQGRCLATKAGHPIQILNDEGEVVATLPRDIVSAIRGSRTTFLFEKADGTYGWTDLNGNIIQQGYKQLHTGEGTIVAVGKKTDEGKWLIYNNKGNQTGSFKGTYSVIGISYGYISVKAENDKAMLLNHKGEEVLHMKKAAYIHTPNSSKLTYCVFTASKDYDDGIVSLDGEELIRPKYYILQPIDDNLIIAKKNDKYGIIDINEQKIIGFKYDGLQLLGDNIFVLDDGDYYIIDRNGKRIGKDTYARRSDFQCDQVVHYVNVDNEVRLIDNAIKDYTNGAKVSTIAQKTHVTPSEALQYTSVLTADEWTIGNMRINISYNFSDGVVTPRTHQVTHNDGWWEWTETVVDSWQWSDATLYSMTIAFDYSNVSGLDADDALEYLRSALLQHGFEEHVGNNVYGKYNKELSLSAETRQENKLFVFITDMIR